MFEPRYAFHCRAQLLPRAVGGVKRKDFAGISLLPALPAFLFRNEFLGSAANACRREGRYVSFSRRSRKCTRRSRRASKHVALFFHMELMITDDHATPACEQHI